MIYHPYRHKGLIALLPCQTSPTPHMQQLLLCIIDEVGNGEDDRNADGDGIEWNGMVTAIVSKVSLSLPFCVAVCGEACGGAKQTGISLGGERTTQVDWQTGSLPSCMVGDAT